MLAIVSNLWIMSLQASVLILIILVVRLFLKKYSKVYSYLLWAIVGLRLLFPVWVEVPESISVALTNVIVLWNNDTEESKENILSQETYLEGNSGLTQM